MNKLYYIKHDIIAQAERMREKLMYQKEVELDDLLMQGCYKDYMVREKEILDRLEELDDAFDHVASDKGCYNYKAEWKYIEILKKYANTRSTLDAFIN
jgi:hypothetical protein